MAFEHKLRVRFHQCDPAGVLFFGRVFELVQATYEDLCRSVGIDIDALLRQHVYSTPIVRVEADYRRPISVGEEVTVRATIERIGETSVTLAYAILGPEGDERVRTRVVHVWIDVDTWNKVAIPDDARTMLEGLVGPAG